MHQVPRFRIALVRDGESVYSLSPVVLTNTTGACEMLENIFRATMGDSPVEVLIAIALDQKNRVIGYSEIHRGSLAASFADPRCIFQFALACNAARIIVAHNHPSGNAGPSSGDRQVANRLREAGNILNCQLLDFLAVAFDHTGKLTYVSCG